MTDKIRVIKPREKTLSDECQALRANLADVIEGLELAAEIRKAAYDAHIKAGFTPEQALDLCWRG